MGRHRGLTGWDDFKGDARGHHLPLIRKKKEKRKIKRKKKKKKREIFYEFYYSSIRFCLSITEPSDPIHSSFDPSNLGLFGEEDTVT